MNKTIDLTTYSLTRTEKVYWRFKYLGGEVADSLKSKTMRSFLRQVDQHLQNNQITVEYKILDQTSFDEWLPFYQAKMEEHGYDVIASSDWFTKRQAKGQIIEAMLFMQHGKLVGSGIMSLDGTEKATLSFKASDRLDLSGHSNSSLGSAIDFMFLKTMVERNIKIISGGKSRNAFGVINNLGYLDYKLRFGYWPHPDMESDSLTTVPVNEDGIVLFYGLKNDQLSLYALKPAGDQTQFEVKRFATPEIPFVELEY